MNKLSAVFLTTAVCAPGIAIAGPDLVKFPAAYKSEFTHYATQNRVEKKQVVAVYANPAAAGAQAGSPLSPGSILVMEVYKAELGDGDMPKTEANGEFVKGELAAVVVMEKQPGWGSEYKDELRNGEWEYAKFSADGTPAAGSTEDCLTCHKPIAGQDFVFTFEKLDAINP
ncbi:MAG: cytochrome P460 family protein [Gammaproteobacteria bacterium]|nr:cytochrome P460 family protein [Gammaproteobacteria bacterium]